jgi:hypothetical protein
MRHSTRPGAGPAPVTWPRAWVLTRKDDAGRLLLRGARRALLSETDGLVVAGRRRRCIWSWRWRWLSLHVWRNCALRVVRHKVWPGWEIRVRCLASAVCGVRVLLRALLWRLAFGHVASRSARRLPPWVRDEHLIHPPGASELRQPRRRSDLQINQPANDRSWRIHRREHHRGRQFLT